MDLMPVAYFRGEEVYAIGFFSLIATIFWVVMLVDAIRREFSDANLKIIWVLVLIFTQFIGALVYFFVGRSMGRLRS